MRRICNLAGGQGAAAGSAGRLDDRVSRRRFLKASSLATGSLFLAACGPGAPPPAPTAAPNRAQPTQLPISSAAPKVETAATSAPAVAGKPGGVKIFKTSYLPDIDSMDPATITGAPDYQIGEAIYNYIGRYTYDPPLGTKINPELATWEIQDDGRTYIFNLRKGVKFHKGYGELTAADVKFNWDRIADRKTGSRYYTDFAGAEIAVIDPQTVKVTFPTPYPAFIQASLAFRPGLIISPKAFKERADNWKSGPIGSGPFEWESWQVGSSITLKRFEDYWGPKPKVDKIVVKVKLEPRTAVLAVAKGELDAYYILEPDVALDVQKNPDPNTRFMRAASGQSPFWLAYNMKRKPFDDLRVRQALRYAIDTAAIAKELYGGLADAIASFLPPFMFGYTADVNRFKYNPDQARKLLKEANVAADWSPGIMGDSTSVAARKIVEAVNSYWNEVGVRSRIDLPERAAFLKRRSAGEYDVFGISVSRIEPDQLATPYWRGDSPVNNSYYSGADDLINQAKAEPDSDKRAKLYADLQRKISEASPAAFIVATSDQLLVNKRVSGISGAGWQGRFNWSAVDVPAE